MINLFYTLSDISNTLAWIDILFFGLILLLIATFIGMIYFVKINSKLNKINTTTNTNSNNNIANTKEFLQNNSDSVNDKIDQYEDEQEKSAIISYSELIKNANRNKIVYDDYKQNDLEVKKINVEPEIKQELEIDYLKEEEYLKKLQNLQKK